MTGPRFLDTNILLRHFTGDNAEMAQRALALLQRVEHGDERVTTTVMVVAETVFTLERFYKVPKAQVRTLVGDIVSLPGVQLNGKALCLQALDAYVQYNISFADAYTAVWMQAQGIVEIYSWDKDFDRIAGFVRLEPEVDKND